MTHGSRTRKQIVVRLVMDGPRGEEVVAEWRGDEPCPGPAEVEAAMSAATAGGCGCPGHW